MKKRFLNINFQKGQSLFEVVLATGVSALIITGIVAMAANSIQNASYSKDKTLASNYVTETMEWLRKERDQNYEVFKAKAMFSRSMDITYCLTSLDSWPASPGSCSVDKTIGTTKFSREITFPGCSPCPSNLIEASVTVSWKDAKGKHNVSSSTDLSIK